MILYTVHVYIEEAIADEWLDWMTRVHMADVVRTRCFDNAIISELLSPEEAGHRGYAIQYNTSTLGRLELYQRDFAARLQQEHTQRYKGRFKASRYISRIYNK